MTTQHDYEKQFVELPTEVMLEKALLSSGMSEVYVVRIRELWKKQHVEIIDETDDYMEIEKEEVPEVNTSDKFVYRKVIDKFPYIN